MVANVVLTVGSNSLAANFTTADKPATRRAETFTPIFGAGFPNGFNGSASVANGLANVTIPGANTTTACLRWDVQVDKPGKAVIMKVFAHDWNHIVPRLYPQTTQEIRILFVNGTMTQLNGSCPTIMSPIAVCADSRTSARAPAPAPTARAPSTAQPPTARAPTAQPPTAPAATSIFANCSRGSGALSGEDLANCLAYLAYGLQTPAAQLNPSPTSLLAQCYTALSNGDEYVLKRVTALSLVFTTTA